MTNQQTAFQQAYRNLKLDPLITDEDLDRFWVEYEPKVLQRLKVLVETSERTDKIVFAGHRGCGKSTLLAKLRQKLEHRFFIVFFSITQLIEMSAIDSTNLLFAIYLQLLKAAEDREVEIAPSIRDRFQTIIGRLLESIQPSLNLGVVQLNLETNPDFRNQLKQTFADKSELLTQLNTIVRAIESATQKDVLVIIDDLDKPELEVIHRIYRDNIKTVFQPTFRIIFTIPIYAVRNLELKAYVRDATNNKIELMTVSKLFLQDQAHQVGNPSSDLVPELEGLPDAITGEPIAAAVTNLETILYRRLPPELIQPAIARQLILKSGGLLRELMRLANECCLAALLELDNHPERNDLSIDATLFTAALTEIRNDFATGLGKTYYEILSSVYTHFRPEEEDSEQFLRLLHGLHVLEYRNANVWYDVHPIVQDLMRRRGLLA